VEENNQDNSGNTEQGTQGTIMVAGVRPITTGTLQIVDTYNSMGIRPIGANTFQVVDSINLSGIRPIASSSLVITENYSIFGNRPIAPNTFDDSEILMGFLD
jgi:flagellar basal body rod protein FlgG